MKADLIYSFLKKASSSTIEKITNAYRQSATDSLSNHDILLGHFLRAREQSTFDRHAFKHEAIKSFNGEQADKIYNTVLDRVFDMVFWVLDNKNHKDLAVLDCIERTIIFINLQEKYGAIFYQKMAVRKLKKLINPTPYEIAITHLIKVRVIQKFTEKNVEIELLGIIIQAENALNGQRNLETDVLFTYYKLVLPSCRADLKARQNYKVLFDNGQESLLSFSNLATKLLYCELGCVFASWERKWQEYAFWFNRGFQFLAENPQFSPVQEKKNWFVAFSTRATTYYAVSGKYEKLIATLERVEHMLPVLPPEPYYMAINLLCSARTNWLHAHIREPIGVREYHLLKKVQSLYQDNYTDFPFYLRYQIAYQLIVYYFVHAHYKEAQSYIGLLNTKMNLTRDNIRRFLRPNMLIEIAIELDVPRIKANYIGGRLSVVGQRQRNEKWRFTEAEHKILISLRDIYNIKNKATHDPREVLVTWKSLYDYLVSLGKHPTIDVSDLSVSPFLDWLRIKMKISDEPI